MDFANAPLPSGQRVSLILDASWSLFMALCRLPINISATRAASSAAPNVPPTAPPMVALLHVEHCWGESWEPVGEADEVDLEEDDRVDDDRIALLDATAA